MQITMTKSCVAGGEPRKPGDQVEVSDSEGSYLKANGQAVGVGETAAEAPYVAPVIKEEASKDSPKPKPPKRGKR